MHLEPWADFCLVFFGGFFAIVTVGLLGAIAFALNKLVNAIDKLVDKADPVIGKATDVIETVQRVTTNVGEKADQILTKGEALTDNVTDRVEKTAGVVQKSVTGPLISLSSLITGVSKGFSVYTHSANGSSKAQAKVYREDGANQK
jgi:uncharacterized protein YoxC